MKASSILLTSVFTIILFSCKKKDPSPVTSPTTDTDNYSSMNDFFAKNGVATEVFNINGTIGGSFTSAKGTKVIIPAYAFFANGDFVTGPVKIEFKDIYDKSDMLLSNKSTDYNFGLPLKSAGEFFIRATSSGIAASILSRLTILQPVKNGGIDPAMQPFMLVEPLSGTTSNDTPTWIKNDSIGFIQDTTIVGIANYAFSLYQFAQPADSGSWCNSDNSSYFSAFPQTSLTLNPSANASDSVLAVSVFLVFKNIDCMVHVYQSSGNSFPYSYAPQGLDCTVVAVGINRKGKVFSSFTPITISANQTVPCTLTSTTTDAFKTTLKALN